MSDFVDKADAWDALAKANARIAELEEALRPFAGTYNRLRSNEKRSGTISVQMRHLARAARALKDTT